MNIDHYTVTVNFRDGTQVVHERIFSVSAADGLVGMSNDNGDKWVYPVDTIRDYHFKAFEKGAGDEDELLRHDAVDGDLRGAGTHDECEYMKAGYDSDCIYRVRANCCHAIAIRTSTRMDGMTEEALRHLLNGV